MGIQRFSGAVSSANGAIGSAVELLPPPGKSITVISVTGMLTSAVFSPFGIQRSLTVGVPTTTVAGSAASAPTRSQTLIGTVWSTPPTLPTGYLAWLFFPAVIGTPNVWRPSQPVIVSTSLVIYNVGATGTGTGFTIEWDEETPN